MSSFARRVLFTMAIGAAAPAVAAAQSNIETNAGIQFDFLNPGARSLGMGGAFLAIADDATTAFTNPAGLREISRKEVSFEVRFRGFETPYTLRGHGFGSPTNFGVDTVAGLVDGFSEESVVSPSFFSFVLPRPKWAVAAYRHELARFKSSMTTEGAFLGSGTSISRLFPVQGSLELTVVDYGVSGSYNISNQVSVGGGLVVYDIQNESMVQRFDFVNFNAATYTTVVNTQDQLGDGRAVGANIGLMVKPTEQVQFAVVYRSGVSVDVQATNRNAAGVTIVDEPAKFNVPDVFGFGLAVRPVTGLRVGVDINRVMYSQLTDGFADVFQLDTGGTGPELFSVEDGTEVHLGAEYLFTNLAAPIAVRAGVWRDPAHSIVYNGTRQDFQALFRERESSYVHSAFGAGFVVQQLEVNFGADLSKLVKTFSVSAVVRF